MSITRYMNDLDDMVEHQNGEFVTYEDHAAEVARSNEQVRAQARAEGIHFAANRLLAAWESGFIDDTPAMAHDISGAILSSVEFLPNADEGEFTRDYADEVRARIRAADEGA